MAARKLRPVTLRSGRARSVLLLLRTGVFLGGGPGSLAAGASPPGGGSRIKLWAIGGCHAERSSCTSYW